MKIGQLTEMLEALKLPSNWTRSARGSAVEDGADRVVLIRWEETTQGAHSWHDWLEIRVDAAAGGIVLAVGNDTMYAPLLFDAGCKSTPVELERNIRDQVLRADLHIALRERAGRWGFLQRPQSVDAHIAHVRDVLTGLEVGVELTASAERQLHIAGELVSIDGIAAALADWEAVEIKEAVL